MIFLFLLECIQLPSHKLFAMDFFLGIFYFLQNNIRKKIFHISSNLIAIRSVIRNFSRSGPQARPDFTDLPHWPRENIDA